MKKELFRLFKHMVVLVVGSALIGTLLLTLAYCLPTGLIRRHVAVSYDKVILPRDKMPGEGFEGYLWRNKETFTDCIMVQYSFEKIPGKNAFEHAMWAYHYDLSDGVGWDAERSLKEVLDGADTSQMYLREYSRYWHGYLVYLKPLLLLFTWKNLVTVCVVFQLVLFFVVCVAAVRKKHSAVAAALLGGLLYMKPSLMLISLDMSVCLVITLAALLVMLLLQEWLERKDFYPEFFLCVGMLTSYFDFLTYPVTTLGIPLCAWFLLKRSRKLLESLKGLVGFSFMWGVGYGGMWACKWLIADLTLRTGTIKNALWTVLGITSGISGHGITARLYGGFHAIDLNLQEYNNAFYPILTILLCVAFLVALVRAIYKKVSVSRIFCILVPSLVIALIPFAWIMAAQFHSALHARFTFRIIGVAAMALCGAVWSLWGTVEGQKKGAGLLPFFVLLTLYPLRRVYLGVDLWDGGYNYANFRYPGMEYMDSMWYFATWISTRAGAFLMRLPFAGTMLMMNVYTGLVVSLLAVIGFAFLVKKLKMPPWLGFVGELTACGLCWAPTSKLYDYLTFLFLMLAIILLYLGLVEERERYLAVAGVLLGLNVGVRFSNLAQMGLILAVWLYCMFQKKTFRELLRKTLYCVAGYAGALGVFLLVIGIRYGLGAYFKGIGRLFTMTEVARDYSPLYMLASVFGGYLDSGYWIKRFGLALIIGTGICLFMPGKALRVKQALAWVVTGGLFGWLLTHLFYYPDFATYQSVYDPCVMFLLFSLAVSAIFLIKKDVTAQERLLAVLEILIILLTSLGGNNALFYDINNMFLTMPFSFFMLWKLWQVKGDTAFFAFKSLMTALALVVCVLAFRFGNTFSYEEATGGRQMDCEITEIPVLRGMRTGAEKAQALEELYGYLAEHELLERSCILYGQIPGISYYMGMKPAFNVWSDLRSYTPDVMRADLDRTVEEIALGAREPVVIVESRWVDYLDGEAEPDGIWDETSFQKTEVLWDFMARNGYEQTFRNPKFVLFEKNW